MTKDIELILLYSNLNTVDRLYIPTIFKGIITKEMFIENIKKEIKQLENGK